MGARAFGRDKAVYGKVFSLGGYAFIINNALGIFHCDYSFFPSVCVQSGSFLDL